MRLNIKTLALVASSFLLLGAGRPEKAEDHRKQRPVRAVQQSAPASPGRGSGRSDRSAPVVRSERDTRAQQADRAERTERAIRGQSTRPSHAVTHRAPAGRRAVGAAAIAPTRRSASVRNRIVARDVVRIERTETTPNRYYWHGSGETRYAHYYTGGYHWYGFYSGPSFYWTRYYGDRWWWYDPYETRWTYWSDGYWWWQGPGGVAYVFVDDRYYPYHGGAVAAAAPSAPAPDSRATISPDSRRLAQVSGSDSQAFLFDRTVSPPRFLKYLGAGVSRVRFADAGEPVQVLVEYQDGGFAVFDADGNSLRGGQAADDAPPAPGSMPPPPN